MKNIIISDNGADNLIAMALFMKWGYNFEYMASSKSLIVEVRDTSEARIDFDVLCEQHALNYNTYVS